MYKVEVKVWDEWFPVKKSRRYNCYKLYKDGFCVGHCPGKLIKDVRVVSNEN